MSRRLALPAVTLTAALFLAACGSDSTETSSSSEAGSTGSETTSSSETAAEQSYPITIEHALGTTTIEAKPERIASVAWANHEVPLALGVVPVGMSKATWGDDDGDGVLPWVEDKLTELGAQTPVLFDETDGIPFEAVADTAPDVILASYSGLTQEEYDTLSEIAPVVAYPDTAWGTTLEDMVLMDSKAMGMEAEGVQLAADLSTQITETAAQFPDLAGKAGMFGYIDTNDMSQVGFYTQHDPRAGFLEDLGVTSPKVVADATAAGPEFYATVSSEEAEQFADLDVIVTYGDDTTIATLQGDALLNQIPAVASGAVAILQDSTPLAAAANPSPLSIGWGLADYVQLIADAAAKGE